MSIETVGIIIGIVVVFVTTIVTTCTLCGCMMSAAILNKDTTTVHPTTENKNKN